MFGMPTGKDYENIPPTARRFIQCRWKPQIATREAARQQPRGFELLRTGHSSSLRLWQSERRFHFPWGKRRSGLRQLGSRFADLKLEILVSSGRN
jgi:hypothetical protein